MAGRQPEPPRGPFVCEFCAEVWPSARALAGHIKAHSKGRAPQVPFPSVPLPPAIVPGATVQVGFAAGGSRHALVSGVTNPNDARKLRCRRRFLRQGEDRDRPLLRRPRSRPGARASQHRHQWLCRRDGARRRPVPSSLEKGSGPFYWKRGRTPLGGSLLFGTW